MIGSESIAYLNARFAALFSNEKKKPANRDKKYTSTTKGLNENIELRLNPKTLVNV